MMHHHPALKKYIRKINRLLPCSGQEKQQLLAHFQEDVSEYLEQHPAADLEALQAHFGTPQEIANQYYSDQELTALLHKVRIRKKTLTLLCILLGAVLLISVAAISFELLDVNNTNHGYVEISTNFE